MGQIASVRTIARDVNAVIALVRRRVTVDSLTPSQRRGVLQRRRWRSPGSTRHIADAVTERRTPAGVVGHCQVAKVINGSPRHVLDEVLVMAIVRTCHDLCGLAFNETDEGLWREKLREAKRNLKPV